MKWFDGTLLKMSVPSFSIFIKLIKVQCTGSWVSPRDRIVACPCLTMEIWLGKKAARWESVSYGLILHFKLICSYADTEYTDLPKNGESDA